MTATKNTKKIRGRARQSTRPRRTRGTSRSDAPVAKDFHLGDILSITTGRLVSPRHIDGVYEILNFMTGDNLFTHALLRASETCRPVLLQQHPDLAAVDASSVGVNNWQRWLTKQVAQFGERRAVQPLSTYEHKHPITELLDMGVAPERIVVVKDGAAS